MSTINRVQLVGFVCLVTTMMIPSNTRGGELDAVCDFLQKHAVNHTLLQQRDATIAQGKIAVSFRRESTLCNFHRSASQFRYDVIHRITQKNWDLVDGKKNGEPRNEDRLMVSRYEFGYRESTKQIVGFEQTLTTTRDNWGGSSSAVIMNLAGDQLMVDVHVALYDDYFAPAGTFYPGASEEHQVWSIKGDKLVRESRTKVYRVDPKTLRRELLEDRKEPVVEQEIAKLPLK